MTDTLTPRQQEIVALYRENIRWSYAKIGAALVPPCTEGTVKVQLRNIAYRLGLGKRPLRSLRTMIRSEREPTV